MLKFQYEEHLWFLWIIPIAIILYLLRLQKQKARLKKIGEQHLVEQQLEGKIDGRLTTKLLLTLIALTSAIFGIANLRKGDANETGIRKGSDIFFALDVSKSMLARDLEPDRLTRSKQLIARVMSRMKNDRVGLVVFAGKAYLQTPLTIDYNAAQMLLEAAHPGMIPTQGTVLADAIQLANNSFSEDQKTFKTLILISDGEDHDAEAMQIAKKVAADGLKIYTVGIGSPEGTTIFDPERGGEKIDENGQPVITKLNEANLQNIAQNAGGEYFRLTNVSKTTDELMKIIDNLEGRSLEAVFFNNYIHYFPYFFAVALCLLIIDWILPTYSKVKKINNKD